MDHPESPSIKMHYREKESAIYDELYAWKTDDVEFWKEIAREFADGNALELACGTLRTALQVAQGGIHVTGIDNSSQMLEIARNKLVQYPDNIQNLITLHEGDMRSTRLNQQFNLIYLPFSTFLFLLTPEDQLALFETVRAHLAPNGVFVFDIFLPNINRFKIEPSPIWKLEVDTTIKGIDSRIQCDLAHEIDPVRQTILTHTRIREYKDNALVQEWLSELKITYIFPRELAHLIARAGFNIIHYWGDYNRANFYEMSDPKTQLLVVAPM